MESRSKWLVCWREQGVVLGFALLMAMSFAPLQISAQSQMATVPLSFQWVDDRPQDSTSALFVTVFFHDGSFDLYDRDKPASQLIAKLLTDSASTDDLEAYAPGVQVYSMPLGMWNQEGGLVVGGPGPETYHLHPVRHRFLTVFIPILPSNDAFIANEDPYRIELFDLAQRFNGPKVIEFYGNEVLDAGLCINNETALYVLDTWESAQIQCEPEQRMIGLHAGFNGSWRNPDALPQRILGARYYSLKHYGTPHDLDVEAADFSRPGARIGHLVIRAASHAAMTLVSGSFYDPARAGEGFNINVFRRPGSDEVETLAYWYTYQPNGSGEPLWLVGGGPYGQEIRMYSMSGGKFASTENPESSKPELWGTMSLAASPCDDVGSNVRYVPVNSALSTGQYPLRRLSPRGEDAAWLCRVNQSDPLLLSE